MQHMTKARCANDTPVFTLQKVTSGPMLSLCADWLAVLGRQPDEIALNGELLVKGCRAPCACASFCHTVGNLVELHLEGSI